MLIAVQQRLFIFWFCFVCLCVDWLVASSVCFFGRWCDMVVFYWVLDELVGVWFVSTLHRRYRVLGNHFRDLICLLQSKDADEACLLVHFSGGLWQNFRA